MSLPSKQYNVSSTLTGKSKIIDNLICPCYITLMIDYRFMERVDKTTDCWFFIIKDPQGYGRFRCQGRTYPAHRYAYQVFKGLIPQDKLVLHKCNNKNCVNPKHLYLGTATDKAIICYKRGNSGLKPNQGERNKFTKLTVTQVKQIKLLLEKGGKLREIAPLFGICKSTVMLIKSNKTWRHV